MGNLTILSRIRRSEYLGLVGGGHVPLQLSPPRDSPNSSTARAEIFPYVVSLRNNLSLNAFRRAGRFP